MKIFACPHCDGPLYFENLACACGTDVMFDPEAEQFVAAGETCANRSQIDCNWQSEAGPGGLCRACAMTEVVPDSIVSTNVPLWADSERAKRWVLNNLGQWGWLKATDTGPRPRFHLLSEFTANGQVPVTMGHDNGLITINVSEADPALRVARRESLDERFRTLTGHFRHELGHYVFLRLAADERFTRAFRALFGDERADYGAALGRHYDQGPPPGWEQTYITAYASSHPHEDWAETFAHLVHIADMVDSFQAAGMSAPAIEPLGGHAYGASDVQALISAGVELGLGLNHVNRSMGLFDIYPFVLSQMARDKIAFVHDWVAASGPQQQKREKRRSSFFGLFKSSAPATA